MCAAKKHINFRLHSSFTVEGKGCQILIGRFAGRDVAIGNIYLQSGTGPTSPLNSKILGWLAGTAGNLAMFLDDHGGLECRCCGNPADQFW